jgi:hypothetical protein
VDPNSLPRAGAPAPGSLAPANADPLSPALRAVQQHAPQLVAASGKAGFEGPDQQTRQAVQTSSDQSLMVRNRAITEGEQAKGMGVQADAGAANEAYFAGWQKQMQAHGQMAAAQKARDDAAEKLNTVKQTPIKDHPDFPEWFTVSSILGSIAGGFAEGFSGGRYKSTTLPMIQQIIGDWRETQKYNRSQLVDSLTAQLGDRDAALNAAGARLKEGIADMAEAKARFARTPAAMAELKATADSLRAQSLDDWGKTQTTVMGKASESLALEPPKGGAGYTNATLDQLRNIGIDEDRWNKGLGEKVGGAESPTISQAATATKQVNADIALLESIKAQNGGTLPTKGAVKIPDALVPTLAKLGYQPGMQAEQVNGLINTYLTQKAKGYGGTITNGDRESAALEFGASGDGFMRGLARLRDANNAGIRTALAKVFPGREQPALNILLERSSEGATGGVPNPPVAPLEKQNVAPAAPAGDRPMQANSALNVAPEEQARIDAELAKSRATEDQQRSEREAEVARRRERPIPGTKF